MPIIKVEYEQSKFSAEQVRAISEELQRVVAEASGLGPEEQSVFAGANAITVNAAPMEIYVYASEGAIPGGDIQGMANKIGDELGVFKQSHGIGEAINLTVAQMNWKYRLGI